ncbi:4946_t:CDS:2 [Diversispora eburnea]|uniref:4946_t:CDS:1 n=1 Tax=Diversispora eburnea TaxID=1213867 RepID=A0A9N8ZA62_9GLOM|nr:4946_t:CDS:2 [Diversispora eburnea]
MSNEAQKIITTATVVGKNKLVVDREKVNRFTNLQPDDYTPEHLPTENEVQIYTWKDATLKEIANLFREVNAEANKPNARLSFKLVYLDNLRGKYVLKDLGAIHNLSPSSDHDTNLDDARFVIGDFLDVAIFHGAPPRSIERLIRIFGPLNLKYLVEPPLILAHRSIAGSLSKA